MGNCFFKIIFLTFVLFVSGCGDLDEESVVSLAIAPTLTTVGVNQYQFFSVIARSGLGVIVAVTPTWSAGGGIGLISSTGLFQAGAATGEGTVTATYGSLSASANVTITNNGWVRGRVVDNKGNRVPDLKVYLRGYENTYFDFTRDNNNANANEPVGFYSLAGVPAGTYEVTTKQTSVYRSASNEVAVVSGETTSQDLTILYFTDPPDLNPPELTLPTE